MNNKLIRVICLSFLILNISGIYAQDFNKEIFKKRRTELMNELKSGIAVFKNPSIANRTNDVTYYPYRTNSNFYYLTGFDEHDAAFVLLPEGEKKFIMFVELRNLFTSFVHGEVTGVEGAMEKYGADTAYNIADFERILPQYIKGQDSLYFDIKNKKLKDIIFSKNGKAEKSLKKTMDINVYVHEMRIIKDDVEIEKLRKAIDISCEAHLEAMKATEPGMYEYEINAIYNYVFNKHDAVQAYGSIVASGDNSMVMHYESLDRKTETGDNILIDMGAEYDYYCADITRYFPVNGKFTKEQKEIYEIVVKMEDAVIKHMKPGNKWFECLEKAEDVAKKGLFELGLITDKNTKWQHKLYFYKYIGHPIGLDVHDVGYYGNFGNGGIELKQGMVFAVEPLLFFNDDMIEIFKEYTAWQFNVKPEELEEFINKTKPVYEKYKGIGARIEDNILITKKGNENLSKKLPGTVEDIEKAMAEKSYFNN